MFKACLWVSLNNELFYSVGDLSVIFKLSLSLFTFSFSEEKLNNTNNYPFVCIETTLLCVFRFLSTLCGSHCPGFNAVL